MSHPPNLRDPFGIFLRACFLEYKESLPDGKISERLWCEKVEEWHTAWHDFRKPTPTKRKKRGGPISDEEWVASLKVDPFLEGVDVDKEIAKCQFHFRNLPHPVIPSRARLTNWLKNADRTVAPKPKPAVITEPPGWLTWMRQHRDGWRLFRLEAEGFPVPTWNALNPTDRTTILDEMRKGK